MAPSVLMGVSVYRYVHNRPHETTVDTDALETVCTVYGEDFDYARLKAQLELFSHEDKDEIQQKIQCRKEQEDEDDSDSREDSEESS